MLAKHADLFRFVMRRRWRAFHDHVCHSPWVFSIVCFGDSQKGLAFRAGGSPAGFVIGDFEPAVAGYATETNHGHHPHGKTNGCRRGARRSQDDNKVAALERATRVRQCSRFVCCASPRGGSLWQGRPRGGNRLQQSHDACVLLGQFSVLRPIL